MKSVPIVILGLLAAVGASTHGGAAHTKSNTLGRSVTNTTGGTAATLVAVVPRGTSSILVLRTAKSQLLNVKIDSGAPITNKNGGQITVQDLRAGDQLVVRDHVIVQDRSLRNVVLSGVVASAPMSHNDAMTVQVSPARTVLIDVDAQTYFSDISSKQTSPTDVVDADTVTVRGVLNTTMDEVVSTHDIERLGPNFGRSNVSSPATP